MEGPNLVLRKPDSFFLQKNMALLPEPLKDNLMAVTASEIKIDKEIIIQGMKNPLITVFIGFSTSHLYHSLKRKKKRIDTIIVIEPKLDVFKELLSTEDVSDMLQAENVDFLIGLNGPELLTELFKVLTKTEKGQYISRVGKVFNLEKVIDPFVYETPEQIEEAKAIMKVVDDTISHIQLSTGCSDDQWRRWSLQFANRHNMFKSWNVDGLYKKFDKTNAIVLGGGPTLDEFVEAYHKYPNLKNCILLAADAVLYKLLKNNIKPHIVFRCERKETQIFKGITKDMTKGIYYAAYPWTPPNYFNLFDDSFYLYRNNGVCLFTGVKHGFVDGGVSSGNACMEFAFNLGCPNVFTAGIDLCLIDGKTHTADTQVEFNPQASKEKWSKIKNYAGEDVTTIPVWMRCLNEYGQSINKHQGKNKDLKVYGTSLKSGKILGAEYKSWEDANTLCEFKVNVEERIKSYRKQVPQEEINTYYATCKQAHADMSDIKDAARISFGLEKDARMTCDLEIEKMLRKIRRDTEGKDWDLIRTMRTIGPHLEKLTKNVADSYDLNFKSKYGNNKFYRICLMDVLQHDILIYENKVNSLANGLEFADDKYLAYVDLTRDFIDRVEFYCDKFLKELEVVLRDKNTQEVCPVVASQPLQLQT